MGDNKSNDNAETLTLLRERIPDRLMQLPAEVMWAFRLMQWEGQGEPPEWVRRNIRCLFGQPAIEPKEARMMTMDDFVKLMGFAKGMGDGARIWSAELPDVSGMREDMVPFAIDLKRRVAAAIQPEIQKIHDVFASFPTGVFDKNVATFAAFTSAQNDGVEVMANEDEETTVTQELHWFLWVLWPEAQTARSVRDFHEWLSHLGLIHCSPKLLEKICSKIGYRPSKRGRKNRIPTDSS